MDSTIVQLDSPFTVTTIQGSLRISVVSITPFISAVISVTFYRENNIRGDRVYLELTGQDYLNWVDDNYLVNYVLQTVGATQAP
jgi:hypothetical protein